MIDFINKAYNQTDFLTFLQNKFPKFEKLSSAVITNDNNDKVKSCTFFGDVELADDSRLGFFEFEVSDNVDIENNRVGFSSFLKKQINDNILNCAIAVFYNPNKTKWRLSFIKIDYDESLKEFATPPTRASFILGEDTPLKTIRTQIESLQTTSIESVAEAFSVEPVSKKFFDEYKKLYKTLCEDIQTYPTKAKNGFDDNYNVTFFVKKLLGRIVFLFFLQKKGWLGATDKAWTDGDRKFLLSLHDNYRTNKHDKSNFYNEKLAPLFFDALNNDRRNSDDHFETLDCKIPYLNGGLFTKDERDKELENNSIKIEDELFEKIFELFANYNFTIIEDSPEDVDIAIDPEMLGKVFEDLLEDRKDKGAFYTPREIVHYMCQQSLINYLKGKFSDSDDEQGIKDLVLYKKTDNNTLLVGKKAIEVKKALENIKVLDPAIGSGAFPMGMLHEIVSAIHAIDKTTVISELKKQVIQNSIYGVDIEESAVEIAKLRFWLSIVVDSNTPEPLPNLFYKIMVGNSLLETINGFDPIGNRQSSTVREIQEDIKSYYTCDNNVDKDILKNSIHKKLDKLITNKLNDKNKENQKRFDDNYDLFRTDKKKIKELDALKTDIDLFNKIIKDFENNDYTTTELFFYKIYFADVLDNGGFDVVIANPPYVRQEKIQDLKAKQEIQDFKSYAGTADLYIYFFEKGFNLLKKDGVLTYITSNKWTRAKYGAKFREFVLDNAKLLDYIDFNGVKVFESATVDTSVMILKKSKDKAINFQYCLVDSRYGKNINLDNYISNNNSYIPQSDMNKDSFVFLGKAELDIKKKIEKIGTPLKDWDININYGIKTGFNEAFIMDGATKDKLIAQDPKSAEIIKPILRGKDIKRYEAKFADLWLINSHNGYKNNPRIEIEDYPAIKNHLDFHWDKISKRSDKGKTPYNLRNCAYLNEFEKEKIVYPCIMSSGSKFFYDNKKTYPPAPANIISGGNLNYLLVLLNSKITYFSFITYYMGGGISGELKTNNLLSTPIPQFDKNQHAMLEQKADEIIKAKERGLDTTELEAEVDQMVYKLYDLTDDEIAIVEQSVG